MVVVSMRRLLVRVGVEQRGAVCLHLPVAAGVLEAACALRPPARSPRREVLVAGPPTVADPVGKRTEYGAARSS